MNNQRLTVWLLRLAGAIEIHLFDTLGCGFFGAALLYLNRSNSG